MRQAFYVTITAVLCSLSSVRAQTTAAAPRFSDPAAQAKYDADPATYKNAEPYAEKWSNIKAEDIVWNKRVWRVIDMKDDANAALNPTSTGGFAMALISALRGRSLKAYAGADERFSRELPLDELDPLMGQATAEGRLSLAGRGRYLLKQDWIYLNDGRGLVGRIIGIAPLAEVTNDDGQVNEQPLFWVYYPALRPFLAQQKVEGVDGVGSLDQWFEGDRYASTINKSSDSPTLKPTYRK